MKHEQITGGMLRPQGAAELELCEALDKALSGDIPFEGLPNSGKRVTDSGEEAAYQRFSDHTETELAAFINQL